MITYRGLSASYVNVLGRYNVNFDLCQYVWENSFFLSLNGTYPVTIQTKLRLQNPPVAVGTLLLAIKTNKEDGTLLLLVRFIYYNPVTRFQV